MGTVQGGQNEEARHRNTLSDRHFFRLHFRHGLLQRTDFGRKDRSQDRSGPEFFAGDHDRGRQGRSRRSPLLTRADEFRHQPKQLGSVQWLDPECGQNQCPCSGRKSLGDFQNQGTGWHDRLRASQWRKSRKHRRHAFFLQPVLNWEWENK